MRKQELRSYYKQLRMQLSDEAHRKLNLEVLANLHRHFDFSGKLVHVFLPIQKFKEVNTWPLVEGKRLQAVVPRADFETNTMESVFYTNELTIVENKWNIWEPVGGMVIPPQDIDMVLAPLLCADLYGNRIGYGKGFYDRFLSTCRPNIQVIGLSLYEPVDCIEDASEEDIRLTHLVTPNHIYHF